MPPRLTADDIPDRTGPFLNGLFSDQVRGSAGLVNGIRTVAGHGGRLFWLIDLDVQTLIIDQLTAEVMEGPNRLGPEDKALMRFFRRFILGNTLHMSIPMFESDGDRDGVPKYRIVGYERVALADGGLVEAGIRIFINLLLCGAHFVVLHASRDSGGGSSVANFYYSFKNDFYAKLPRTAPTSGTAVAHSHYKAKGPSVGTGLAYPFKWDGGFGWEAARAWPLVPILLVDTTAWAWGGYRDHNSFFQMEGWSSSVLASIFMRDLPKAALVGVPAALTCFAPSPTLRRFWVAQTAYGMQVASKIGSSLALKGGVRHGADFQTHEATKWNISTYGACAYSEKRGGTVFLHHRGHADLQCGPNTIMAPYVGAETRQGWLDTGLVRV